MFWRFSQTDPSTCWQRASIIVGLALALMFATSRTSQAYDSRAFDGGSHDENVRADEPVIGTFHIKSRGRRDVQRATQRDGTASPDSRRRTYTTADFVHLFADARAALDEGDVDEARRLFERVIAVRPESELADEARQHLRELYGNARKRTGKKTADQPSSADAPERRPRPRTARRSPGVIYGPVQPRNSEVLRRRDHKQIPKKQPSRRLVMLERQFIADVGDRIFFAEGSDQLGSRARAVLAAQADWLIAHPDIFVTIEGHADDGVRPGIDFHNLSLARAEAVRQRLSEEGVPEARMTSMGRGKRNPVAACSGHQCAAQNRRVVTVISDEPIRIVGDSDRHGRRGPDSRSSAGRH